jgi:hypothetical protein
MGQGQLVSPLPRTSPSDGVPHLVELRLEPLIPNRFLNFRQGLAKGVARTVINLAVVAKRSDGP